MAKCAGGSQEPPEFLHTFNYEICSYSHPACGGRYFPCEMNKDEKPESTGTTGASPAPGSFCIRRWLLFLSALTFWLAVQPSLAQDIEPRRWSHVPIGANFAGAAYAYTTGDIYFDPELQLKNVQFDLQTIGVKYIRSFELFGKSARVELAQPYQFGHWTGLVNGTPATVDRNGLADTSARFAVNLIGAPPLKGKEFAEYRA